MICRIWVPNPAANMYFNPLELRRSPSNWFRRPMALPAISPLRCIGTTSASY